MNNKLLKALMVSGALVLSTNVSAANINLENIDVWGIDVTGSGDTNNITLLNYLDYDGSSFAESTVHKGADPLAIDAGDTFVDYGYLYSTGGNYSGGNSDFGDYMLTTLFDNWAGTYTNATPFPSAPLEYDFESGDMTWTMWETTGGVKDVGTDVDILSASIIDGSGQFIGLGAIEYVISLTLEITDILADDYVYVDINGDGILEDWEDLYDVALTGDLGESLYFNTTISFVNLASDPDGTKTTLEDEYALQGISIDLSNAIGVAAVNDGNLEMAKIPEPGMLSLMGLGFLGLAGLQRRRRKS